jgi:hypothetical protein
VLAQFRGYVEEITGKVSRGIERGQTLDELKKTITVDTLASLKAGGAGARVEREITTLFPRLDRAPRPVDDSVVSNIQEVFTYFKERKGRREIPLK